MNFFEKVENLPEDVKDFFSSDHPRTESERVCFMYGIEESKISLVTKPTGLMFVKDIEIKQLPDILSKDLAVPADKAIGMSYELTKRLFSPFPDFFTDSQKLLDEWAKQKSEPVLSEDEAWQKVLELEPWLKEQDNNSKEKIEIGKTEAPKPNTVKMPVSEVLKIYPTIGEQLVSKNHIKLKIFPEPVRPSVKNWITDYTENLGYSRHTSIQRGEYLFKGENGKSLDNEDRGKVSQILKSFDESSGLEIDTEKKQILFEKNVAIEKPAQAEPETSPKIELGNQPSEKQKGSTGDYCRYAPPVQSDTKFHSDLPNQIHLKHEPSEKETPKTATKDESFTVNLKKPIYIRPATSNGNSFGGAEEVNPENIVNLKK